MNPDHRQVKLTAFALGEMESEERLKFESTLSDVERRKVESIQRTASVLEQELAKETFPANSVVMKSEAAEMPIETEYGNIRRSHKRFPWLAVGVAASVLIAFGAFWVFQTQTGDDSMIAEDSSGTEPSGTAVPQGESAEDDIPVALANGNDEPLPEDPVKEQTDLPKPQLVAKTEYDPEIIEPNQPELTKADDVEWINKILRETWAQNEVRPSTFATDGEFIRRVYLDMVGHVPPAEEASEYIASREPDKKQRLVLKLVNSDEFASYWSTVWSNLLIGRTPGRNINGDAMRKYLRDGFAENRPWNRMVFEMVSATGGSTPRSLERDVPFNGATNFLLSHMNDGNVPATSFATRLFLGVQTQCTQCHDHPFNDRTQESFWGINAFFQQMNRREYNDTSDTGQRIFLFAELNDQPMAPQQDVLVTYDKRDGMVGVTPPMLLDGAKYLDAEPDLNLRKELATYLTHPDNEFFAKAMVNRVWAHFLGRGIVHLVDDLGSHNAASIPELLKKVADTFGETNYDIKRLMTWVALSEPYALSSRMTRENSEDDQYFTHYPLKQLSPEQMFDSLMVATRAAKAGSRNWDDENNMRTNLLRQFTVAFGNDENTEADTFNGTIPQALLMMNSGLMGRAVSTEKGSFLREQVQEALGKGRSADTALLNDLYLAALSRYPNNQEKSLANQALAMNRANPVNAYQDIFWSLLNSSEFVLNH